jgi:hypothetical protein
MAVQAPPVGLLIYRPYPKLGIGTRLLGLAGAVWLARRQRRAVVVDWRGSLYLADPVENYFSALYEHVPEILGVPMLYPPATAAELSVDALVYERPKDIHVHRLDPEGDPAEHERFLRAFYESLVPRREIADELERWADEHLRRRVIVGLNVSTGNGYFDPGSRLEGRVNTEIFRRERRFLRTLERACTDAARKLGAARDDYAIFYATDSAPMSELLGRLPNAVTRRRVFPPPGVGRRFSDYASIGSSDTDAAADTLIDMLLLARCDALIRNRSLFSNYALVVTGRFGGNVVDLESLFRR